MDDIARQDRKLLIEELTRPSRIVLTLAGLAIVHFALRYVLEEIGGLGLYLAAMLAVLVAYGLAAYNRSVERRFVNKRYLALWNGICDRLKLFHEVLRRMRKDNVADLLELPKNVERVAITLYAALRRSDLISHEVTLTEKGFYSQPPTWSPPANDAQVQELYRIADKNIAEYRHQFAGVMAGVQRTEAQSAVFMTTVDSLRMKMLGYRLVGRSPELSSKDFIAAMQEAKMQLAAIDQALEELELTPFPKTVAVLPSGVAATGSTPPAFDPDEGDR